MQKRKELVKNRKNEQHIVTREGEKKGGGHEKAGTTAYKDNLERNIGETLQCSMGGLKLRLSK